MKSSTNTTPAGAVATAQKTTAAPTANDATNAASDNIANGDPFIKAIKKICKAHKLTFTDKMANVIKAEAIDAAIAGISPQRIAKYELEESVREQAALQSRLSKIIAGENAG